MSLEFLKMIIPETVAHISHAFPDEQLLTREPQLLDQIPSAQQHRPKEKYTASRLRIEHEWIYRLSPSAVERRLAARSKKGLSDEEATSQSAEVWVHQKPSDEEIKKFVMGNLKEEAQAADQSGEKQAASDKRADEAAEKMQKGNKNARAEVEVGTEGRSGGPE